MRLWIIQLGARFGRLFCCIGAAHPFLVIIIGMTELLAFPLGKIRQPRVIAEVIGGIILGPTGSLSCPFPGEYFPTAR